MLVVLRFTVDSEAGRFVDDARAALAALARRPGFVAGQVGRAFDEPSGWTLVTEWESVGAYRRALGAYEVKVEATPLLARAHPEASAFEPLLTVAGAGEVRTVGSDRADTARDGSGPAGAPPTGINDGPGQIASRP